MGVVAPVVLEVNCEGAGHRPFVQHYQMVQTTSADGADDSFAKDDSAMAQQESEVVVSHSQVTLLMSRRWTYSQKIAICCCCVQSQSASGLAGHQT